MFLAAAAGGRRVLDEGKKDSIIINYYACVGFSPQSTCNICGLSPWNSKYELGQKAM